MSKSVDNQRHEDSVAARITAAKERMRLEQRVLTCFVEGLGIEATARRIESSADTVSRIRIWLGIDTGRSWKATGKRTGRRDSRRAIEELRP